METDFSNTVKTQLQTADNKLARFDGTNYTRWKDRMVFLLTALKVFYVLDAELAPISDPTPNEEENVRNERSKRKEDELVCRGYILNSLTDRLFDLHRNSSSPKEIWASLEAKYKNERRGTDKFIAMKYFEFVLSDDKNVIDQIHALQILVSQLSELEIKIPDAIQIGAILAKLPPSWNDFRKKMLHSSESYTVEELHVHLQIEAENRIRDADYLNSRVHLVSEERNKKFIRKVQKKRDSFKKTKPYAKITSCFHCGKPGHVIKDCRLRKKTWKHPSAGDKADNSRNNRANVVEKASPELIAMVSELHIGMITELHMAAAVASPDWWLDSGATIHVCNNKAQFKIYEEMVENEEVLMGNHVTAKVVGKGTVELNLTSGKKVTLVNVFHVPDLRKNLVSANLLCKKGFKIVLESDKVIITKNGVYVGKGYSCDGMFKLSVNEINNIFAYVVECSASIWHSRLAHLNYRMLKYMNKHGYISCHDKLTEKCEVCVQAKMPKKPFPKVERSTEILDLVHSDICEFNGNLSRGGKRYFITFIDDSSRFTYVYLLRNKSEAFEKFKEYKTLVENQKNKKIKIIRSDRGGEYFPESFTKYCEDNGIIHQRTAPYSPQMNGIAERKNRTYIDMINSVLLNASLPYNLWGEALFTACHINNRVPFKKLKKSPYEIWFGRKPNLNYFRVWGCISYYKVPESNKTKLGPKGIRSVFVGYAQNSKAYRLLDLKTNVIVESIHVEFFENKFINSPIPLTDANIQPSSIITSSSSKRKATEDLDEPRRSLRKRKEKTFGPDFISPENIMFLVEGNRTQVLNKIPILLMVDNDPKTFRDAMSCRDASFWKEAIDEEMNSLISNNTWIITDLPQGSKPIRSKWVFRRKYNTDGSTQAFKARLVAKGFTQREGVDYFDTYAPVARISSIRVLIALASIHNLIIHQMDVKTAFLNGDLNEELYMEQPEGFVLPRNEKKVCKLIKSLYGLKQAPKQWHEKFDYAILAFGFKHNSADRCIYSKVTKDFIVIISLYVDDLLIFSNNIIGIQETKGYLKSSFNMKDLNEVDTILGIKIKKHDSGYVLNQSHYFKKLLESYQHLGIKETSSPYDSSIKFPENNNKIVAQLEYASVIGSLMYAMHSTRPDLAFAVCKLSRYTSKPSTEHWKAIIRLLGYIQKTINYGLYYSRNPSTLEGYSDASWITSINDNKSTSGWIYTLGGGAVSWASKKQSLIAHSTMEAEFIALTAAGKEAEWLRNFLLDIELWPQPMPAISLYCDSQATMSKAYNNIYNGKSRHIGIRHAYIRELITSGVITIVYVKSKDNLADPLTKALPRDVVCTTTKDMGLRPV